MSIVRNPAEAAERRYDLIVVGGGIYGAFVALEASSRGLSVVLLEKADFGGATSYNSLKTIHGGLRYLQTFNVRRRRISEAEQQWFLRHFPDLVKQQPVLMPLYQHGLRRTGVMRTALWLDSFISRHNSDAFGVSSKRASGTVVGIREVKKIFPLVDDVGLKGGAIWWEAWVPDTQRLIMEVLGSANRQGATILNYLEVTGLKTEGNSTKGVIALDEVSGQEMSFWSDRVVNAAGPWSRALARKFHRDFPKLFRPSVAWNVLIGRDALSEHSLAISQRRQNSQLYFAHPWKGRILVGTGHAPRASHDDSPGPTEQELNQFIGDINAAVPGLKLRKDEITHVYAGFLPVTHEGTVKLSNRAVILDHCREGGPHGLYSVSGVKYTESRSVAAAVVKRLFPESEERTTKGEAFRRSPAAVQDLPEADSNSDKNPVSTEVDFLARLIREEAIVHLDDLIFRRSTLGDDPERALQMAPEICRLFEWDDDRCRDEIARVARIYNQFRHSVSNTTEKGSSQTNG